MAKWNIALQKSEWLTHLTMSCSSPTDEASEHIVCGQKIFSFWGSALKIIPVELTVKYATRQKEYEDGYVLGCCYIVVW